MWRLLRYLHFQIVRRQFSDWVELARDMIIKRTHFNSDTPSNSHTTTYSFVCGCPSIVFQIAFVILVPIQFQFFYLLFKILFKRLSDKKAFSWVLGQKNYGIFSIPGAICQILNEKAAVATNTHKRQIPFPRNTKYHRLIQMHTRGCQNCLLKILANILCLQIIKIPKKLTKLLFRTSNISKDSLHKIFRHRHCLV